MWINLAILQKALQWNRINSMQRFVALILLALVVVGAFLVYRYAPNILSLTGKVLAPITPTPVKSNGVSAPAVSPLYVNVGKELSSSSGSVQPPPLHISQITPKGSYGQYSQINLRVSGGASGEKVNITGWRVKTDKDYWVIPRGSELYGSETSDVFVKSGDTVNIYSHSNRLSVNYRVNKCIGYIKGVTPENYSSCPYINKEETINFSGLCQNYINLLGSCQMPDANPPVPANDSACLAFLSKLNYTGCVSRYGKDSDFYTNEWRIWLTPYGSQPSEILDPYHGVVQLLDRNGKLVDQYSY